MSLKFNKLIKKLSMPFMWISGCLIFIAIILSNILENKTFINLIYLTAFVLSGIPILVRAIQALKLKTISIELLVSIASIGACFISEYNESAIVTFLFQFGSYLEQKTIKKTRSAIKSLTQMSPKTAWKILKQNDKDNTDSLETQKIDADEIEINDILLVKTGNQIACDGIVVKGEGYVIESTITGESNPIHKKIGDKLYAGTILDSGTLQMKSTKVGEDTTFAKIIALVEEAQDAKSPAEKFIDKFAKYYTPMVIILSALVLLITKNIDTAITVLVLACPGALVIGAPIANVAGIGKGAKEGILLKGGDSINEYSKTSVIVFDKTGTLTEGKPKVIKEKCYSNNRERTLEYVSSLERNSDHPISKAIIEYIKKDCKIEFDNVESIKGQGIKGIYKNTKILVGNMKLIKSNGLNIPEEIEKDIKQIQNDGSTIAIISENDDITMILGINDNIKEDAIKSIKELKKMGISKTVMLTGDNYNTAQNISKILDLSEFKSELLPEDKLKYIKKLQEKGYIVTFVGDGINDTPALATSNTGIAMGSGTDVAIECSDIVLIKSDLTSLVKSLKLSKKIVRILYENIFIAIGTVLILLIGLFAGYVHMGIGMLIHEMSIMIVIFNAMRLLISKNDKNK